MAINTKQTYGQAEVIRLEAELKAKGYRLVGKTNETILKPYEYIKRTWSGTSGSFEGPTHYVITWRIPDLPTVKSAQCLSAPHPRYPLF